MTFDPVTLALAQEYADEKFEEVGGSVAIDLDKHGIGPKLLELFAQGGGKTVIEDVTSGLGVNLWNLLPNGNPFVNILLSIYIGGSFLAVNVTTKSFSPDLTIDSMSFSFLGSTETGIHLVSVLISRSGETGAYIALRVS